MVFQARQNMSTETPPDETRPPSPHDPSSDRIAWICMIVMAVMTALVLVWATTLTAD